LIEELVAFAVSEKDKMADFSHFILVWENKIVWSQCCRRLPAPGYAIPLFYHFGTSDLIKSSNIINI